MTPDLHVTPDHAIERTRLLRLPTVLHSQAGEIEFLVGAGIALVSHGGFPTNCPNQKGPRQYQY